MNNSRKIILASSLGTIFEWYDFYLFGSLAGVISKNFFSVANENLSFLFALLTFAAGFFVRPFGALLFGRLGDTEGRRNTFLSTIILMGISTTLVGLIPSTKQIGILAPITLILLRLLQGLAIGGEYGGATIFVAEHAKKGGRGFCTSWIQITATLGMILSLGGVLLAKKLSGPAFELWGWRIPFLFSFILLIFSIYYRSQLHESELFQNMIKSGSLSKSPVIESFNNYKNLKMILLSILGIIAGQAVVWYTGHFYSLYFLTKILLLDETRASFLIMIALFLSSPFYLYFGYLSDKIGRKKIILTGLLLSSILYYPLYSLLSKFVNPSIFEAQAKNPISLIADQSSCHVLIDPIGKKTMGTSCDIAQAFLVKEGISFKNIPAPRGTSANITIGNKIIPIPTNNGPEEKIEFEKQLKNDLYDRGHLHVANIKFQDSAIIVFILFILLLLVTMVYGPLAAYLVELFPTRLRYTSVSFSYHLGNGWFGGFLPSISFALIGHTGNIYSGILYPVTIAFFSFIIGFIFLPETNHWELNHND